MGKEIEGRQKDAWAKHTPDNVTNSGTASVSVPPVKKPKVNYPSGVFKINDTRVIYVTEGTSYLSIAYDYNVPLKRLFEFNDMSSQEVATTDQLIFIQRKRKTGADEFYKVAGDESLYEIAQKEGIRFESLLAYNFLRAEMSPQAGEVLYLHQQAPAMPRLAKATAITNILSQSNNLAKSAGLAADENYIVHTVQPKETMFSIAKRYSVNKDDVLKWNDLQSMDLKSGQQIRIKRM